MRPLAFAWRGLVREPIRACLGVAGIAVVGALLFDMLLLARGLTLSFAALLEDAGYDVRVTASQFVPSRGPMILDARRRLETLRGIPEIADVAAVRFGRAELDDPGGGPSLQADFMGIDGARRGLWRVIEGGDLAPGAVIVNHRLAERLALGPGDAIALRGACDGPAGARPQTRFTVAGVVRFRFEGDELAAAATRADLLRACEPEVAQVCGTFERGTTQSTIHTFPQDDAVFAGRNPGASHQFTIVGLTHIREARA